MPVDAPTSQTDFPRQSVMGMLCGMVGSGSEINYRENSHYEKSSFSRPYLLDCSRIEYQSTFDKCQRHFPELEAEFAHFSQVQHDFVVH